MAALESLAAGVPCLSTPMPALQEMLGPQAGDWLAADEQAQSLARTVLRVLQTAPSQRRALAHDLARPHSRAAFGQHWHEELLRSLRQPLHGTARTVHFVHAGRAYMPELFAYETHLTALGHHTRRHSHPATVPVDADIVWWMCGRVSADHSHRLRRSLHVHEYASASVGRWPAVKDLIKRWSHPRPDNRIFLNEWVRERMGFDDGVPCSLRDMGVPPAFLHAQATQPADHDLVYLGEMGRLRSFLPVLQLLSQAGIRLLLIGQLPDDLARQVQSLPHIQCTGRLPQEDVPQQLLRARAGLNLMPNQMPLSMQTSTKVLEYLATGLPVLSNAYPWAQQMASEYPERVRLLNDLTSSGDWLQALSALPPCQADRSSMHHLAWPVRLARLPAWEQLGLVKVSA